MLTLTEMPLRWATVRFHLLALDTIEFTNFPGFVLRSGFGAALRRLCRFQGSKKSCTSCEYADQCPYAYIFETPQAAGNVTDFSAEHFPHPFVMAPPYEYPYTVPIGQSLTLQFTLFGNGIPYLMFYIYAFDLLGDMGLGRRRSRFVLERVTDAYSGQELFCHRDKILRAHQTVKTLRDIQNGQVNGSLKMQFNTPAKILHNNRSLATLTIDALIRSLLRRVSLLAKLHENQEWQLDYGRVIRDFNDSIQLVNNHTRGIKLMRYSVRQRRKHPLYALCGETEITGEVKPFLPLLKLGEVIHIGSSTGQGLGKYQLRGHNA
jgi:hypothetical protein